MSNAGLILVVLVCSYIGYKTDNIYKKILSVAILILAIIYKFWR